MIHLALAALIVILGVSAALEILLRPLRKAAERSATANELTALYARELCRRAHYAARETNARGEVFRWEDPAEQGSARDILADADEREERRLRREEQYGKNPEHDPYVDYRIDWEALNADDKERSAFFSMENDIADLIKQAKGKAHRERSE